MTANPELLYQIGGCALFRRYRSRNSDTGARLLVKSSWRCPTPAAEAAALRRECDLLLSLDSALALHPRIVDRPAGLALVMEDPGGEPLSSLVAQGQAPVALVLALGIQVASTLAQLHRAGIAHNGVRPDAILCDPFDARAWLVDFADASGVAAARRALMVDAVPTERLLYLSPEQTGRTERAPDHRSDLYSLGVVLYQMLTGAPPFQSNDALELVHWHIARTPIAPTEVATQVPPQVSDLVMKLLAKEPEERYQSAMGLVADLQRCAGQWNAQHSIATFTLGQRDFAQGLSISPRLYGREAEVATLLRAFEQACRPRVGRPSMLLVAGYTGIGKTALIQYLYKPIIRQKGYFVAGKFDQVVRTIPFGALIQAFRSLVRQLLTESQARLDGLRDALRQALGSGGGVLAQVIPEIEFVMGPQPTPVALGSTESINRFRRVFEKFMAVVAQPSNPLVIFLDDLQWADAATLSLLEPLLTSPEVHSLLLIGAYRDNELDSAYHLTRTLAALESSGVDLQRVTLGPLRLADIGTLLHDTLHAENVDTLPLARLVFEKTGGNPFFVIQFLKTLERDGLLRFDQVQGSWSYSVEAIANAPLPDDVVDLMSMSIRRLSSRSQYALTLAACIGSRFDQGTLAIISKQSPAEVDEDLQQAVAEGLIVPALRRDDAAVDTASTERAPSYAFLHDRVQQAAYALIPAERKAWLHLTIGRLLLAHAVPEQSNQRIFDILHHLNAGRSLITSAQERTEVARLNLRAGRKTKASTAFDAALDYFLAGIDLLGDDNWTSYYDLCFSLHLEAAESQYLCGNFDAAQLRLESLLGRAATAIDQARVYRLRSLEFENMARYADALASARAGLGLFGVYFPDAEAEREAELEHEITMICSLLGGRPVASLVDLPVMTDAKILIVMNMLTDIWASVFILGEPTLARLISATMVRLSLVYGNVEESAYGYVTHAITVGPVRGDYRQAYEFGTLALTVNQRFNDARRRAKIYQQFHAHVNFWCEPFATCIPYAREACRSGLESGDFLYAAYGAATETWSAIITTPNLAQFVHDYTPSVALIEKLKNPGFADSVKVILNWARALQAQTQGLLSLSDSSLDENDYLQRYRDNPFFTTFHAVAKLHLCCLLGTPAQALRAAQVAGSTVHHVPGTVWPVLYHFWSALALAANYEAANTQERCAWLAQVQHARAMFEVLAQSCADNFLCPALLLAAEIERIEGRTRCATDLFEQAIEYAGRCGMLQYHALASELCAKHRLALGQTGMAALLMAQARACYARWGAAAKLGQLDAQYPELLPKATAAAPEMLPAATAEAPSSSQEIGRLDVYSVMKAAQAIAGEVELDRLLARLMRILIENAGAERGCLVLAQDGESVVFTANALDPPEQGLAPGTALAASRSVPLSIVNYVRRTSQSVVLDDAPTDDRFGGDPYIQQHRPRSVMCVAVQKQGQLVGVLYLDNSVLAAAFTADRLRVVQMLATQTAISLENARLFDGLKREISERMQAQQQLGTALVQVEQLKENLEAENVYLRGDLIANVSHDLRTPLVSLRGYLEILCAKHDALPPETRNSYLEIALRQSEHLARLIDELFELAKLDFKGLRLDCEPFQLVELAVDVVQKFQLSAQHKQVSLKVDAPAAMPLVHANLGLIERVLDNLIGNALQHTPGGGTISLQVMAEDARVAVRVADTGTGIPQAELPFIFDRFYRVDKSRSRASGGAGLGLAIAKRIVELHDGTITVQSQATQGSCFSFSLPVQAAP